MEKWEDNVKPELADLNRLSTGRPTQGTRPRNFPNPIHNERHERSKEFPRQPKGKCYRYGSTAHYGGTCPHRETICHGCNKNGHLKKSLSHWVGG